MLILVILSSFLTLTSVVLFSRSFFQFLIKRRSEKKFTKLHTMINDVHFSFEELTYFVSLPNRNPDIFNAKINHFHAKPVFRSFIFPVHEGLMITVNESDQVLNIAFMDWKHFRIPLLERWRHEQKINEKEYEEMRSYVLMHKRTRKAFIEEAYRQIRRDDRILIVDEPIEGV
ncbi:hypothetical protein [Salipaludibacillus daqingensis]|uniref:hypothetical protein n=1 Tax=Salipaludibacillus daqingensis TaxID=3041001 RepID=UPI00247556EF|nr:hypothetical protein [Salipaludibacillus daqingensis]